MILYFGYPFVKVSLLFTALKVQTIVTRCVWGRLCDGTMAAERSDKGGMRDGHLSGDEKNSFVLKDKELKFHKRCSSWIDDFYW